MNITINLLKNIDKIISGDSTWQGFSEQELATYQAADQANSLREQLHEKLKTIGEEK
ncbi:hypothetical protein [Spiroplasma endosymbiont of Polydrusus formosus]|uniref:hypothetical protein n=1 Tax=Spiroplasma endosymbiont of Polydrusus formosus TaxID=3139326 RepID=UPI0035B507E0